MTVLSWWFHTVYSIRSLQSTIIMADISKMKGLYQFLQLGLFCHLEIIRLLWSNRDFCSLKLPADTATNVEIIVRKRALFFWLWNMQSHTARSPERKNITWLPISPVFPPEAFPQMNILGLNSHRKLQVLWWKSILLRDLLHRPQ